MNKHRILEVLVTIAVAIALCQDFGILTGKDKKAKVQESYNAVEDYLVKMTLEEKAALLVVGPVYGPARKEVSDTVGEMIDRYGIGGIDIVVKPADAKALEQRTADLKHLSVLPLFVYGGDKAAPSFKLEKAVTADEAMAAYNAGAVQIMMKTDPGQFISAVAREIETGKLSSEDLDNRVRKILAAKAEGRKICPYMHEDTTVFQGLERRYYTFVPDYPAKGHPVVMLLHGYGTRSRRSCEAFIEAARKHGFAVCEPLACYDTTGRRGWNVGYPMQKGMKVDDIAFISALVDTVSAKYGFNPNNAFLSGMSNGGEMCYYFAYRKPERFKAISSVSGLTMAWIPEQIVPCGKVPFMETHGTGDVTSYWQGDLVNQYGWGRYLGVDDAVSLIVKMDGCTAACDSVNLPLLRGNTDPKGPSRQVVYYRYTAPSKRNALFKKAKTPCEVRLYKVIGSPHSWHLSDFDTCDETLKFFELYVD